MSTSPTFAAALLATSVAMFALVDIAHAKARPRAAPRVEQLTAESVNTAMPADPAKPSAALRVRAAVLLDRARVSPGAIDGRPGDNLDKAVRAYRKQAGLPDGAAIDTDLMRKLTEQDVAPALVDYTVTQEDMRGPFTRSIPVQLERQARLDALGYRDDAELLAERFHMDVALLRELNRGKRLDKIGTVLSVASVSRDADPSKAAAIAEGKNVDKGAAAIDRARVARIAIDKAALTLSAFDAKDRMVAFYPVSVGSEEKPAPSGTLKVVRVSPNPTYVYNPKYAFKGVRATSKFTVAAGPNNPVGAVWIALDQEGYGIHGTPEPTKVGKSQSHGCIRMTNWSALELAAMVDKGVPVEFGN